MQQNRVLYRSPQQQKYPDNQITLLARQRLLVAGMHPPIQPVLVLLVCFYHGFAQSHPNQTNGTDDNGWHSALSEISNVYLYKNVRDLLTKITKDENELYSLITQFMKECIATLQSSAEDWFVEQDWSTSIDSIDACIECEEIEDMFISSMELVPDGVEYIDADGEYASAVFSGTATFYLGFQYIDHTSEIYDREDHAWYNTIYGKGSAEIKVPFTGMATVLIHDDGELELNASGFDEINLGEDEIMDYQLNPYCTDDDPYFDTCPDCGRPIGLRNDGGNGFCADCAPNH